MNLSFNKTMLTIVLLCIVKETSGGSYFEDLFEFNPIQAGASYFQSFFVDSSELTSSKRTTKRIARQSENSKFVGNSNLPPIDSRNGNDDDDDDDDDDGEEEYDESIDSSTNDNSNESDGRLLSESAFNKISETLGALNTVGHFIVDMTRGGHDSKPSSDESSLVSSNSVPNAILTLTKNVLGQNVTNKIEPLIKRREDLNFVDSKKKKKKPGNKTNKKDIVTVAKPVELVATTLSPLKPINSDKLASKEGENRCKTPDGRAGRCEDLSSCPALLLDLGSLRDSLCFKSLFVPGVCCPIAPGSTILTTQRPLILTTRPTRPTVRPQFRPPTTTNLVLLPQINPSTTTKKPFPPALNAVNGNVIDPDDCGQQEYSSGRIVGGIEAQEGQWPWLAAIFLHGPKRTEFWCGGSLVGVKYVLTAAHCTRDSRQKPFAARQFTVRLGDIDLSTDGEPSAPVTFAVKEIRAHEKFSRVGFYNDIAILVLDRPVRKSKYVIPLCLPKSDFNLYRDRLPGRRATVVGWGTTYYGGKESTIQRQADLPIWKNEDCDRAYFQPINENFLCAGYSEGGVDACQGDSGGPLMMRVDSKWTQLGVVSFGNKCGEPGYPGVYTRVSQYLEWIRDHTKE